MQGLNSPQISVLVEPFIKIIAHDTVRESLQDQATIKIAKKAKKHHERERSIQERWQATPAIVLGSRLSQGCVAEFYGMKTTPRGGQAGSERIIRTVATQWIGHVDPQEV